MKALSIAIIIVFIVLGMIIVAVPALTSITSTPLNNNDTYAKVWAGTSGSSINIAETIAVSPNPTQAEIWTPGATNVYVISVPKGNIFSQSIVPQLEWSNPSKPGWSTLTNWYINGTVKYEYSQYDFSTGSFEPSTTIGQGNMTASGIFQTGSGYAGIIPGSFPVEWNITPQNDINSAFGILTVKMQVLYLVETSFDGFISNVYVGNSTVFAQIYVLPGTSTINPVKTVFAGQDVYITGTTWYGDYNLIIRNPSGAVVYNDSLPSLTTPYPNDFNVTWQTPTGVYGEYTVEVYNYIVQTSQEQFFSVAKYSGTASGFLPKPTITVSSPGTLYGVYRPDTSVTYTIQEQFLQNQSIPNTVYFNVNIWVGSASEEPPASSGAWISYNMNDSGTLSGRTFTYTGSFVIPYVASGNYITIDVVAVGLNTSSSGTVWYASQPVTYELSVGNTPPPPPPPVNHEYAMLEIVGFILAGLVTSYLLPDDVLAKVLVFSSALFSAVLIYWFVVV